MQKDLILKKCQKCGALVEIIKDCTCENCGVNCCGEPMSIVKANSVDASFEKHVPNYTVKGNMVEVFVNHVMEEDHYIMWIAIVTEGRVNKVFFKPGDEARTTFHYVKGAKIYSYCNKHSLWENVIE